MRAKPKFYLKVMFAKTMTYLQVFSYLADLHSRGVLPILVPSGGHLLCLATFSSNKERKSFIKESGDNPFNHLSKEPFYSGFEINFRGTFMRDKFDMIRGVDIRIKPVAIKKTPPKKKK